MLTGGAASSQDVALRPVATRFAALGVNPVSRRDVHEKALVLHFQTAHAAREEKDPVVGGGLTRARAREHELALVHAEQSRVLADEGARARLEIGERRAARRVGAHPADARPLREQRDTAPAIDVDPPPSAVPGRELAPRGGSRLEPRKILGPLRDRSQPGARRQDGDGGETSGRRPGHRRQHARSGEEHGDTPRQGENAAAGGGGAYDQPLPYAATSTRTILDGPATRSRRAHAAVIEQEP